MKPIALVIAVVGGLLAAGCTGDDKSKGNPDARTIFSRGGPEMYAKGAAPAGGQDMPNIPAGARWTIYCTAIASPDHIAASQRLKAQLIELTKMRDWYIVHGAGQSTLYYGYYSAINDPQNPKESERAKSDQRAIASLSDKASGERIFRYCPLVELASANPTAPSDWDLANAKGYWSVQVAAYKDHPDRKQFAIDAVREFRQRLGVEAYYYHGPAVSSVCIGAWPRDAVKAQETDAAHTRRGDEPLLVTNVPLPFKEVKTADGRSVTVVQPKLEIADAGLAKVMKEYPEHWVNGQMVPRKVRDPKTGQILREVHDRSFLVVIPGAEDRAGRPTPPPNSGRQPHDREAGGPSPAGQPDSADPGTRRLRSVGN